MKNVDEMSLDQRIMELQQCVSKARVGAANPGSVQYEFLLNSKLGDERDGKLSYFESILAKAGEWKRGKFDSLDYDVRQQTITDINNKLVESLLAFPGYAKAEELNEYNEKDSNKSAGLGR